MLKALKPYLLPPLVQKDVDVYVAVTGGPENALLARLSGYIRRPFWAFSTEVMPARSSTSSSVASASINKNSRARASAA